MKDASKAGARFRKGPIMKFGNKPTSAMSSVGRRLFWIMCLFVGLVSAYDCWLLVQNAPVMLEVEENPVCKALIAFDGGRVDLLLHWKAVGTTLVFLALKLIDLVWSRGALAIASSLAALQALLLGYLTLG